MAITREENMIARQMTPFFSSTLWVLSIGIFRFSDSNLDLLYVRQSSTFVKILQSFVLIQNA